MQWKTLKRNDKTLQELLAGPIREYVVKSRWYGGKNSKDKSFFADHLLPVDHKGKRYFFFLIEILYQEGFVQNYLLPIGRAGKKELDDPKGLICAIPNSKEYLVDATYLPGFREALYHLMRNEKTLQLGDGYFLFERGNVFRRVASDVSVESRLLNAEQSNTTIVYNDQFFLKLYRRLFRDPNPDIEMVQYLSEKAKYRNIPAFAASITWKRKGLYDVSFAMMQEKVENKGDAWTWMLKELEGFFGNVREARIKADALPGIRMFTTRTAAGVPELLRKLAGKELMWGIRQIAWRTVDMHIHLSEEPLNRAFVRQTYNNDYSVWLKNRINYQFEARYALLDRSIDKLDGIALDYARFFQENKTRIKNLIYGFDENDLTGLRIRIHGDYHLGQLLVQDEDFVILDFEGEPEATIHDRKVKQSPLKDVSGMFRSFHYAIYSTIFHLDLSEKESTEMFEIGEKLYGWMVAVFLDFYLKKAFGSKLNIGYRPEIKYLLEYHLLEKAIYELGYELNARPDWAVIPLRGIYTILQDKH